MKFPTLYPRFFTATNLWWKPLLADDEAKEIVCRSLQFLHDNERAIIYGFVIMPNHLHLIWQMHGGYLAQDVQRDFLRFTGQQIKFHLQRTNVALLEQCAVDAKDRQYQIWERNSLSIDIYQTPVFIQKLHYMHQNPVKAGLCAVAEEYYYSSAALYANIESPHQFLTNWWLGA